MFQDCRFASFTYVQKRILNAYTRGGAKHQHGATSGHSREAYFVQTFDHLYTLPRLHKPAFDLKPAGTQVSCHDTTKYLQVAAMILGSHEYSIGVTTMMRLKVRVEASILFTIRVSSVSVHSQIFHVRRTIADHSEGNEPIRTETSICRHAEALNTSGIVLPSRMG